MRYFEEKENEKRIKKYGNKANHLNISWNLLRGRRAADSINIVKLIENSDNFNDLKNNVAIELYNSTQVDFLHFTLILGLFFDCFNKYDYHQKIDLEVIKKIVESKPNSTKTLEFLGEYEEDLYKYLASRNQLDYETYQNILRSMFVINNDYYFKLYNSDIVWEIGKVIMGYTLNPNINSCEEAVIEFENQNEPKKEKIKKGIQ